ncbi:MAG: DUF4867 family protein [Ruthenibacterium sp.]
MQYEAFCEANKNLTIHRVTDDAFRPYGMVRKIEQVEAVMEIAKKTVETPENGNRYVPDIPELTSFPAVQALAHEIFGGLPAQAGVCTGTNTVLNGFEFHQCSEGLVAVEDCALILGNRSELRDNCYPSDKVAYFYMEKGQVVELYSTTLHYTPCRVGKSFSTIVMLLKGTNLPMEHPAGLLTKTNKWFITHASVAEKIAQGAFPGLVGDIPAIKPLV